MKTLLINLTRFGDLLQSQAAIRSLRGESAGFFAPAAGCAATSAVARSAINAAARFEINAAARPGKCPVDCVPADCAPTDCVPAKSALALVCLSNFAETASLLEGIDAVFPLPGHELLRVLEAPGPNSPTGMSNGVGGQEWAWGVQILEGWREGVKKFAPGKVCNLTPSLAARLLGLYCSSAVSVEGGGEDAPVHGFGVDSFGFGKDHSLWAVFLQAAALSRGVSPFNLVDLFRAVAGESRPATKWGAGPGAGPDSACGGAADSALRKPPAAEIAASRARLEGLLAPEQKSRFKGFVALQPGASEERRRWPLEYFARVGARLWHELGYVPVLLGSAGERKLEEEYAALNAMPGAKPGSESGAKTETGQVADAGAVQAAPFISLMGRTTQGELAAALCNVNLLISNDTGTMHLAAGLERPVLAIFLATAQPWDTGPYLAGSCSLEPDLPCHPCSFRQQCPHNLQCRHSIKPELVFALAATLLKQKRFSAPEGFGANGRGASASSGPLGADYAAAFGQGRIWLAGFDNFGFMDLQSLSGHEDEFRTIWLRAQRLLFRHFLDLEPGAEFCPPAHQAGHALPPFARPLPPEEAAKLEAALSTIQARLALLREQGKMLQELPLSRLREKFLQTWQKLEQDWAASPHLQTLARLWRESTQNREEQFDNVLAAIGNYERLVAWLLAGLEPRGS